MVVGVSVGFGPSPHADKARLSDVMPLHLRKSRREIFFDLLVTIAFSSDSATQPSQMQNGYLYYTPASFNLQYFGW
jgi:hypothetical protein